MSGMIPDGAHDRLSTNPGRVDTSKSELEHTTLTGSQDRRTLLLEDFNRRFSQFATELGFMPHPSDSGQIRYLPGADAKIAPPQTSKDLALLESKKHLERFFAAQGIIPANAVSVCAPLATTELVSAAVQVFEKEIQGDDTCRIPTSFIAQPVVRSRFKGQSQPEMLTSFINLATVAVNASIDEHFASLQSWMKLLDAIGLDRSLMEFHQRPVHERKWGQKRFEHLVVSVKYKNCELGDFCLHFNPAADGGYKFISDSGFGLERLRWMAGNGDYPEAIGLGRRLDAQIDPSAANLCRSLVLLAGSGLKPENTGPGYQLRRLSKMLIGMISASQMDLTELAHSAYGYWRSWGAITESKVTTLNRISAENERNWRSNILGLFEHVDRPALGLNFSSADLNSALRQHGYSNEQIAAVLDLHPNKGLIRPYILKSR